MAELTDKARSVVYAAIDALNEQLPVGQRLEKRSETVLLGRAGTLDSVGFINLIVLVEERCQDECGVSISLTDNLETQADDPFQTVGSIIHYVCGLIEEQASCQS